jgi:hypothetical protein
MERSMYAYLEKQMFRPVPGGYIFQAAPPTRFHHTQSYVVSEAQKAEILKIAQRGRAFWIRTSTLAALALGVVTGVLTNAQGAPGVLAIVLGCCVWFIAQILGTVLILEVKLRQLQPILAGLPHSDERLFPDFDHKQLLWGPPPSSGYIAIWGAVFAFIVGQRFEQHPPFADVMSTVLLVGLAINLFWAIRGNRAATPSTQAR